MPPSIHVLLSGLALGASLIIPIGAQNAFVLRQGLRRVHVFPVAAICTICDWSLIMVGAAGFGSLISAFPLLTTVAAWGGAAFLGFYGALSFKSAFSAKAATLEEKGGGRQADSLRESVLVALAVSLLNPHVYLDTVVLIGGLAAQYEPAERAYFATGAGLASLLWFFGLGYGARLLGPFFRSPKAWRFRVYSTAY